MSEQKKEVVAVDADGVILNFLQQWEEAGYIALGRRMKPINGDYELMLKYGTTKDETDLIWKEFNDNIHWNRIPALEGAIDAIHDLVDSGFDVHIITAVTADVLTHRLENFRAIGMRKLPVHIVPHVKLAKLIELNPIAFIDDNPFHIKESLEAGIKHRIHVPISHYDKTPDAASLRLDSLKHAVHYVKNIGYQPTFKARSISL